ncbi:styrene monooxygenase/indole monooxygenase family protein [Antarcticimicrobium luteum]|uniref:FAD-binding oxidoreductase n=1 Tax=Antarcticimicrobium luteum TaxID=2547397 RepID=A0A4R5UWW9_9RHOB|nr:styrene monooxygenase/indole monooxygenase family protein [Antarcticimicrobium luteum]TDK43804.1 FAD-binding oxidoreductase [Antarcticimicrobium luteum]
MRKFTIIGGGQSGLQLGLGLLKAGHKVRVVQNRTADEIEKGKVLSSQCMFGASVQHERDLGLDFWSDSCPPVEGINFMVPHPELPGEKAIDWTGRLERNAYSVDQRVKIPRWLAEFEKLGGELVIADAGIDEMEQYAAEDDLVIVASGKGEIGRLFERDASKSPYDKPQRALALTYVTGMTPRAEHSAVCFNLIPGVGEYFVFPALTTTGPCEIMVFEGVPGGPMDCWGDVKSPEQHLAQSKQILDTFLPWEAARCRDIALTDDNGILAGRFPPTVRKPIATLPSGRQVLGLGDTVCLNDPITGQGSNNASKAAAIYLERILGREDQAFDAAWMQGTFDAYWDYAQWVVQWTNMMLMPPPEFVLEIMGTACAEPRLAHRMANGFDDPRDFFPWFADPDAAAAYLQDLRAA